MSEEFLKKYVSLCYIQSEEEFRFGESERKEQKQIKQKILASLKLQELIKEKINQEHAKFDGLVSDETYKDLQRQYHSTNLTLQSLVKESEL